MRRHLSPKRGLVAVALMLTMGLGLGVSATSAAPTRHSVRSASGPSALTKKWIAALGRADQRFPQIVKALGALPATAPEAQVQRIITPVAGLVEPIQALLTPPGTTLEAFGQPEFDAVSGCGQGHRFSAGGIEMAGQLYGHGIDLWTDVCQAPVADTWSWHIGSSFRTFTALVGLQENSPTPASLAFLGPGNTLLTFSADGQPVTTTTLIAGVPSSIVLSLSGITDFVISTSVSVKGHGAWVDFANDQLTSSQ